MSRSEKVIGVLVVALVGAWGCSKNPGESAGAGGRNPSLEAKAQRLEEDFRAAAAARDQFRQRLQVAEERLTSAESRAAQLQTQYDETKTALTSTTTERDTLRSDLKTRTTERDNLSAQYEAFRKNLKSLLGQAETSLGLPSTPPVTVGTQPADGPTVRN
jgi:chromosome segregation ATPase